MAFTVISRPDPIGSTGVVARPKFTVISRPIDQSSPILNNADGSFSTEKTIGISADIGDGEKFYNIPTIVDGRERSAEEAVDLFRRGVNKPVGVFATQAEADAAAPMRSQQIGEVRRPKPSAADELAMMRIGAASGAPAPVTIPTREEEQELRSDVARVPGIMKRRLIEDLPAVGKRMVGNVVRGMAENPPSTISLMAEGGGIPILTPNMYGDLTRRDQEMAKAAASSSTVPGTPANWGARVAAEARADITANAPDAGAGTFAKYVDQAAQSLPLMLAGVAASVATRSPATGAAVISTGAGVEEYGQAREGGRSTTQAQMDAVATAITEAVGEKIPLRAIIKPGGQFLARTLKSAGLEGVQEIATEIMQAGYDKAVVTPEMTWADAWARVKDAGIVGALMGGPAAAVAHPFVRDSATPEPRPIDPQDLRPGDVESPIPTDLIAEGRRRVRQAGQGVPVGAVPAETVIGREVSPVAPAIAPAAPVQAPVQAPAPREAPAAATPQPTPEAPWEPLFDQGGAAIGDYQPSTGAIRFAPVPDATPTPTAAPQQPNAPAPVATALPVIPEQITPIAAPTPQPIAPAAPAVDPMVTAVQTAIQTDPGRAERVQAAVARGVTDAELALAAGARGKNVSLTLPTGATVNLPRQRWAQAVRTAFAAPAPPVGAPDSGPAAVAPPATLPSTTTTTPNDAVQAAPAPRRAFKVVSRPTGAATVMPNSQKRLATLRQALVSSQDPYTGQRVKSKADGRRVRAMIRAEIRTLEGKPPAVAKPRRARAPNTLWGFIASKGGIRDDEGHSLAHRRGLKRFVPGAGPVIRKTGMSIDRLGELMWEQGYFGPSSTTPRPTEADVLEYLDQENSVGGRSLPVEEQIEADQAAADERDADELERAKEDVRVLFREVGEPVSTGDIDAIVDMLRDGQTVEQAVDEFIERRAVNAADSDPQGDGGPDYSDDIPFEPELAENGGAAGQGSGRPEGEREAPRGSDDQRSPAAQIPTATREAQSPEEFRLVSQDVSRARQPKEDRQPTFDLGGPSAAQQVAASKEFEGQGRIAAPARQEAAGQSPLFDTEARKQIDIEDAPVTQEPEKPRFARGTEDKRVPIISVPSQYDNDPFPQARLKAQIQAKREFRGSYTNVETGWDISVGARGIKKAASGVRVKADLELIAAIPELLRTSALVETAPGNSPDIRAAHTFIGAVEHAGSVRRVSITVLEDRNGRRFYDQHSEEKKGPANPAAGTSALRSRVEQQGPAGPSDISIGELLTTVKPAETRESPFPGVSLVFTEEFAAKRAEVTASVRQNLDKLGLNDVDVLISDAIESTQGSSVRNEDGFYLRKVIYAAMDAKSVDAVVDHEVIHALRNLGLFTKSEWSILENEARRVWMKTYAQKLKAYAGEPTEVQIEEAVAFAHMDPGAQASGIAKRLFQRVRDTIRAIANALQGNGFDTAERIFQRIASGEVGSRERGDQRDSGPMFARSEVISLNESVERMVRTSAGMASPAERASAYADFLIVRGARTGHESLIATDALTGQMYDASTSNKERTVAFSPAVAEAIENPKNALIIQHNHPSSTALSSTDIASLAHPGLRWAIAHGHDRSYTAARLVDGFFAHRDLSTPDAIATAFRQIDRVYRAAEDAIHRELQRMVTNSEVTIPEATSVGRLMVGYAMHRAGILEYRASKAIPARFAGLVDIGYNAAVSRGRLEFGYETGSAFAEDRRADRSTNRVHTGWDRAVGELFGRDQKSTADVRGDRGEAAGPGKPGRSPQAQRAQPEQLRLLEEEEILFSGIASQPSAVEYLKSKNLSLTSRLKGATSRAALTESVDRWRTGFQDRFLPLLRVQKVVERQLGRRLGELENPYLMEELSSGRKGAQIEDLTENMVRPLVQDMQRRGVDLAELEEYLYARHAPERNARIAQINPKFRGDMLDPAEAGSGMTDEEAADIIAAADKSGKRADLDALAEQVDAILAFGLETRLAGGLISEQQAKAWRSTYEHYVPLRGEAELDPGLENDRPRTGQGINIKGSESQRALGRKSKARDIVAFAIMQAEEAIIRAEKNRVAQAFHELANSAPNEDFWKVDKVSQRPVWNSASQQVEYQAQDRILAEDKDYTVSLKIEGVEHRVTMNRKNAAAVRLADAMRSLGDEKLSALVKTFGTINRYLSQVNTTFNPEFVITNAFRDLQTAVVNLNQFDVDGIVANTVKDYPRALKGSLQGAFGKDGGEWTEWFDEFRRAGGRVYFNRVENVSELRTRLERELKAAKPGLTARKAVTAIGEFIESANLGVENAIRLSAYKNAREAGMTQLQAASLAKNLTVNFNRRGSFGPLMNSLYLFYNASVQGTAVMLTAMKSRRVRRVLYGAVALGAALEALNAMMSGDDDDGEKFYDKISDYDKSRNLIIMDPMSDDGRYFKIPLPYGYNVFFAIGRSAAEVGRGKSVLDSIAHLGSVMIDSFNPIGGAQGLLNVIAPTVADPLVDLVMNRDFSGKPIMPEQSQYGPEIPENQRYWSSVSPFWKAITDTLSDITGGDDVIGGAIDVSPEVLDYMFGQVTGAAGSFLQRVADFTGKAIDEGQDLTWNDVPLVRKLVGSAPPWYDKSIFYERTEEIEQVKSNYQKYRKAGDAAGAERYLAKNSGLIKLSAGATTVRNLLADLRNVRAVQKRMLDDGKITAEQYRTKIDAIDERETSLITNFNKRYLEATQPRELAEAAE